MKKISLLIAFFAVALQLFAAGSGKGLEDGGFYKIVDTEGGKLEMVYTWKETGTVFSTRLEVGQNLKPGAEIAIVKFENEELNRSKATILAGSSYTVDKLNIRQGVKLKQGDVIAVFNKNLIMHDSKEGGVGVNSTPPISELAINLLKNTGIYSIWEQSGSHWTLGWGKLIMIGVGIILLGLAVFKGFEPLLLIPIGFGAIMSNIPLAGMAEPGGLLYYIYYVGVDTGIFPLLIFMGVGAMTDFGPLIANPKTALLGAAAQTGIFFALIGAVALGHYVPGIDFDLKAAASIGIIGGADGPTAIFLTSKLAPNLLGSIAVAAYSYMALVPIIQPPIMKFFTNAEERKIKMTQTRHVSKLEKVIFPLIIIILCILLLPDAAPLVGMLMFGNFMRECAVVDRLSNTAQNALINIVTIMLGLTVGSKLSADKFLNLETLGILVLGLVAFCIGTASGVLMAKFFNKFFKWNVNPLIGAAGVSAVPMAARVVNKVGLEDDPHNFLLMHAMGPNVAGVIGSAVAAGVLLATLAKAAG